MPLRETGAAFLRLGQGLPRNRPSLDAFFARPVGWAVANYGKDTNHELSSRPCARCCSMLVLGLGEKYVKRRYGRGGHARCQAPEKPRKSSATRNAAKSARKSSNVRQAWRRKSSLSAVISISIPSCRSKRPRRQMLFAGVLPLWASNTPAFLETALSRPSKARRPTRMTQREIRAAALRCEAISTRCP